MCQPGSQQRTTGRCLGAVGASMGGVGLGAKGGTLASVSLEADVGPLEVVGLRTNGGSPEAVGHVRGCHLLGVHSYQEAS